MDYDIRHLTKPYMSHPEEDNLPVEDNDTGAAPEPTGDVDSGSAPEKAPEGGLFEQLKEALGKNMVEGAKVEAIHLAAEGYAMGHKRAVEILEGLSAEEQMALVQKGVTGIELTTFKKIMLIVNPGMVIMPAVLESMWNGFKRNMLAKVIPNGMISDVSWLASQPEVVAMFSTGVAHAKNPEIARAADAALGNFLKNTGTAAKVVKLGGTFLGQPEIAEGAVAVEKGAKIATEVVSVFPKVRGKIEAKRAEVATTQVDEHDAVADADPAAGIRPIHPWRRGCCSTS